MSAILCLNGKVAAGTVDERAAEDLKRWIGERQAELDESYGPAEALRRAAIEVADDASLIAARKADLTVRQLAAQVDVLSRTANYEAKVKALRATPGDWGFGTKAPALLASENKSTLWSAFRAMLARDPHEVETGANVHYVARDIRAQAHAGFAQAIEFLRPKLLGLKAQATQELDVLAALYGRSDASPDARAAAEAFATQREKLRADFNAAGGSIPERKSYRLPNPSLDRLKVASTPVETFIADMRAMNARDDVVDFVTGKPLSDAGFDRVMRELHANAVAGWTDGAPSAAPKGRAMLANSRSDARVISLKDEDSWLGFARKYGEHDSPYQAMMDHFSSMADDIAMLRLFGPNPEAIRRLALDLFDRETGRLIKTAPEGASAAEIAKILKSNEKIEARVNRNRQSFENLWDHTTGAADVPVDLTMARTMGNVRGFLVSTQMGSAIISSLTDPMLAAMTARFNGLDIMPVISRAVAEMGTKGSEITAAQHGLIADSIGAHLHGHDRYMGETIRSGVAAKLATGTIRASGLRRWTAALRNAFGLEFMAQTANRTHLAHEALPDDFRAALSRYGIDAERWDAIRTSTAFEPDPGARLMRAEDIRAGGSDLHLDAADRFSRMINTEMDYAVIEGDPLTRSLMYGNSKPGTPVGEARRAVGMYKSFPITFVTLHFARAAARGWDGSRLGHSAIAFTAMWAMGIIAMQAKQIANGKDPYSLDPSTGNGLRAYGAALLQGGGLGIFGDLLGTDQTRTGNTFIAAVGGPIPGLAETLVGDFVLKNIQAAGKGEKTHFAGDALYAAARYVPGSSLWMGRLAFQRGVVDQLALMIDDRAPERFARMEAEARKGFGQKFWWRPGRTEPARAPDFTGADR